MRVVDVVADALAVQERDQASSRLVHDDGVMGDEGTVASREEGSPRNAPFITGDHRPAQWLFAGRNGSRALSTAAWTESSRELRPPGKSTRYLAPQPYWRSRRTRAAIVGIVVTTAPPSPSAPRFLVG